MHNDTGDTVVGPASGARQSLGAPPDLNADTLVRAAEAATASEQPPGTRRTQARTDAPRPAATASYRFRIGGLRDPISLDRPARIGRRPTAPRVVDGAAPRLVRVVSPQREVSATHLEVRQIGVSIVITDLRSTNGTVVLVPGSIPRKLLQGESIVVSPGTLVDIGDENILQILPLDRRPS
ncbi:MAG: FHA domain-containing protein [Salinibacterium sp.]|nr:FHA domain-containing protein [Salinibacterium sp.]